MNVSSSMIPASVLTIHNRKNNFKNYFPLYLVAFHTKYLVQHIIRFFKKNSYKHLFVNKEYKILKNPIGQSSER